MEQIFYNFSIALLLLSCMPIGRLFGISGFFPAAFAGLIILSIPGAIFINFNALLGSFITQILAVVAGFLFALTFVLRSVSKRLTKGDLVKLGLWAFILITLFVPIYIWSSSYLNAPAYGFESHDYYFASIPFEMRFADYHSRLRLFFVYPNEWAQYYFLQGVSISFLTSYIPHLDIFVVKIVKHFLGIITIFCAFELVISYFRSESDLSHGLKFYFSKRFFYPLLSILVILALLFSIYLFGFSWGIRSNGFLAFASVLCFMMARIRQDVLESYAWLMLLALGNLKAMPVCYTALVLIFLHDQALFGYLRQRRWKSVIKSSVDFILAKQKKGVALLFIGALNLIYAAVTISFEKSAEHASMNIQSSFTYAWWELVPEVQILRLLFDQLGLVYANFDFLVPFCIGFSALLVARAFRSSDLIGTVYYVFFPLVIFSFLFPPSYSAPLVSIFSFSLLVPFAIMVAKTGTTKNGLFVFPVILFLTFYFLPDNTKELSNGGGQPMFGNINNLIDHDEELIMDNELSGGKKSISKFDSEFIKYAKKPQGSLYCSHSQDLRYAEAFSGHLVHRLVVTQQNIKQADRLTISLRFLNPISETRKISETCE